MAERNPETIQSPTSRKEDSLAALGSRLGATFVADAAARAEASRWIKAGLIILGALLAGIGQTIPTPSEGVAWNMVLGFTGVLLVFAGGAWSLIAEQNAPAALELARQALDRARETSSILRESELETTELRNYSIWLASLYTTSGALREAVENLVATKSVSADDLQRVLDTVARPLHGLLGFSGGEYWTIAIFKFGGFEETTDELICVAHQRSDRTDEAAEHRRWKIGEGIAGHAYQTGRETIVPDATDPKHSGWLHVPDGKRKEADEQRYVSMAAIPVRVANAATLWGVVVATSDQQNRFSVDMSGVGEPEVEPLRLLASMVALAVAPHCSHKNDSKIN